jgi:hypothetical protein
VETKHELEINCDFMKGMCLTIKEEITRLFFIVIENSIILIVGYSYLVLEFLHLTSDITQTFICHYKLD